MQSAEALELKPADEAARAKSEAAREQLTQAAEAAREATASAANAAQEVSAAQAAARQRQAQPRTRCVRVCLAQVEDVFFAVAAREQRCCGKRGLGIHHQTTKNNRPQIEKGPKPLYCVSSARQRAS